MIARRRRRTAEGPAYEGLRRGKHPQRRRGGARRLRQDAAGVGDAVRRRHGEPARPGRRRHHGHRLRPRGDRPQAHPQHVARLRRMAQDQDQPARHPRGRQFLRRHARRLARRRRRDRRRRCRVGPGGADREGVGRRRRAGAAADRRAQPVRPRSRLARTHHRRAAPHLPSQRDAGPPADRRGRRLHRPGRRRRDEGLHRAARRRTGGRGPDPRGAGR